VRDVLELAQLVGQAELEIGPELAKLLTFAMNMAQLVLLAWIAARSRTPGSGRAGDTKKETNTDG
jgi:hypothetical protein